MRMMHPGAAACRTLWAGWLPQSPVGLVQMQEPQQTQIMTQRQWTRMQKLHKQMQAHKRMWMRCLKRQQQVLAASSCMPASHCAK